MSLDQSDIGVIMTRSRNEESVLSVEGCAIGGRTTVAKELSIGR